MNSNQIKTMKKYILYTLLFNPIVFFAMEDFKMQSIKPLKEEQINTVVSQQANIIHEIINQKYLGINPDSYFKAFTGSLISYYETTFLYPAEVMQKIKEIETCIAINTATTNLTPDVKKRIFKKLFDTHWYVHYLVRVSIQQHVEEFKNVTCATIDQLLHPDFTHDTYGIKKMIHESASDFFSRDIGLSSLLENTPYKKSSDIHFTILYGHTANIKPKSMQISKDGKYLKTKDKQNTIVWDTKNGLQILSPIQNIKWSPQYTPIYKYHCVIDQDDNYAALCLSNQHHNFNHSNLKETLNHIPANIRKNKQAILLFVRPTLASYLCQQAFDKCLWQKFTHTNDNSGNEQLTVLENSKSFKALEGFPQKNLTELIKKIKNDKDLIQ